MDTTLIRKKFEAIGARIKFALPARRNDDRDGINVDIQKDKGGEYFEIRAKQEVDAMVMDIQKGDRHLLLMSRDEEGKPVKFLCGHDERHWFTAAVPKGTTVIQAKQALKPGRIVDLEAGNVKTKNAHKRHRKLENGLKIHRQGEFMFIPKASMTVNPLMILKRERLSQKGNPHLADELYRTSGKAVYVRGGEILQPHEFEKLPVNQKMSWRLQHEVAFAYVRGKIKHPEHATLDLGNVWHEVLVNTEASARGARNVRFID